MLNRNIPLYEGALPYLYACYSPEDEMLVLPVLARMYNEGFRIWSANLVDRVTDFIAVKHVAASSCVVMFMSHNMLERINSGVPEALAACRSSLLRTVVLLDDASPDNRLFALSAPERVEYYPGNDSVFWLFAYSADYLERCRGPWPEKRLEIREPTFDDVQQEIIAEEYISLEKIIVRGGARPEQIPPEQAYPNNRGYVQSKPDGLSYEPLKKVEAARTVHDRDYDDAIALLDRCAEKQVDIIVNHTRPGENTTAARPSLSPIRPMQNAREELRIIRQELERTEHSAERPERKVDPEVRTKADMIVQPEDSAELPAEAEEVKPELPVIVLPVEDLTPSAIAAGIEQIAAAAEKSDTSEAAAAEAEEVAESAEEETAPAEAESAAEEQVPEEPYTVYGPEMVQEILSEDGSDIMAREYTDANGKNMVQVVVRRQQPAVRVTPVKKRVITEPINAEEAGVFRFSRQGHVGRARTPEAYDSAAFEQYVRDIVLSTVSSESDSAAEAAAVSHRRYGRTPRPVSVEAEEPVTAAVSVPVITEAADTQPAKVTAAEDTAVTEEQPTKANARKNRYPHNSGMLVGLLAALRHERTVSQADEPVDAVSEEPEPTEEFVPSVIAEQHNDMKIIRLSDAISERKVSDLQAAVNKFVRLDGQNEPASAPLTVRTYGIRR